MYNKIIAIFVILSRDYYLSTIVSSGKPVPSGISKFSLVASPRYPVAFASKCEVSG